jgi:hypothetical protein
MTSTFVPAEFSSSSRMPEKRHTKKPAPEEAQESRKTRYSKMIASFPGSPGTRDFLKRLAIELGFGAGSSAGVARLIRASLKLMVQTHYHKLSPELKMEFDQKDRDERFLG